MMIIDKQVLEQMIAVLTSLNETEASNQPKNTFLGPNRCEIFLLKTLHPPKQLFTQDKHDCI